jgi:hydroxymethylpyrimidine pyrophosphatase-like HAD family hydrolase
MQVVESDRVAFFDCDETLIFWEEQPHNLPTVIINGREFQVHNVHLDRMKRYFTMGWPVVVWSGSGYKWAKQVCEALGVADKVTLVMSKPHRIFDDQVDISKTLIHGYMPLKD